MKGAIYLLLIFLIFCNSSFGQDSKTLWDETEIGEVSTLLYRQINTTSATTGTGTIIYHGNRYFLITASHVAKDMDDLTNVVFRIDNDKPLKRTLKEITLRDKVIWKIHPEADIAIIELRLPNDDMLKKRFETLAFPIDQIYNGKELPSRSADITFLGFPVLDLDLVHFSALLFNANICSGLITQKRGDNNQKCTFYYLNTPSIQGCSGSGVFLSVKKDVYVGGDKTIMIGIMHGTYSDNTGGKIAAVTPSYYIFDLFK